MKASRLVGFVAGAALAVAAFGAGDRFGRADIAGHNLLPSQIAQGPAGGGSLVKLAAARQDTVALNDTTAAKAAQDASDDFSGDGPGATFQQVYLLLKRNFVDGIPDDTKLGHGAAQAMLASLQDPNSRFLEASEMTEITNETQGAYHGLGALLAVRKIQHPQVGANPGYPELRVTVETVLPGSPAEKADLRTGDVITNIGDKWIATYDPVAAENAQLEAVQEDPVAFNKLADAIQKKIDTSISVADAQTQLDQDAAIPVNLTIERPGAAKPLSVPVTLSGTTQALPVEARTLPGDIGYIRIDQFTDLTNTQFDQALTTLGPSIKGLIIDLRNSPGGLLDAGASVAGSLTTDKTFAYVETKDKKEDIVPVEGMKSIACPVVAIVNQGTANTAELLAAALHDSGDQVVGTPTFGDTGDVKAIQLRDGSGFTMTVGKLLTDSHVDYSTTGIKPDVAVPDDGSGNDAPLARAIGVLSGRVADLPSNRG